MKHTSGSIFGLGEAFLELSHQVQGLLDFMGVKWGVASMGAGVQDALGCVEDFVDQPDVLHDLPIVVLQQ